MRNQDKTKICIDLISLVWHSPAVPLLFLSWCLFLPLMCAFIYVCAYTGMHISIVVCAYTCMHISTDVCATMVIHACMNI